MAAPTANPDSYEGVEDSTFVVDAAGGVLANDVMASTVVLESGVSNGVLDLNPDGSFTYTPDENFNGQDSFTYRAEQAPTVVAFTVDQSNSTADLEATINAGGFSLSDSDTSSVTGTMNVFLSPAGAPFGQVQIQTTDLVLADDVDLNYSVIFLLSVDVSAGAGDITLSMTEPGPVATANAAGEFTQLMNDFEVAGTMDVQASGVDFGVPNGPQDIGSTLEAVDLSGTITESGGILTLNLPVTFTGTFPIGDNTVDIEIDGTVIATAPVPAVEQSAPATVTIDVDPINDAPLAESERYRATAGQDLVVPVMAGGADEVLVATGAVWKYLDDGSDAGSAWREPDFDDSVWSSGTAELGYGEGDEVTVLGFGGDAENVFVTTYFRHTFEVAEPDGAGDLLLRLKRDDGAAVYLNGIEVVRDGLPAGAAFDTLASSAVGGSDESTFFEFVVPASALVDGTNTIAVEIHQASITSSDLSFDLGLTRAPASGLLANDSDIDGQTLTASLVTGPSGGSVVVETDGSFVYAPTAGFSGSDAFVYAVNDGGGNVNVDLVERGARWRYLDDGSDQGVAWRDSAFDDSSWSEGAAELGYGEGDEATVVGFGGVEANKFITTYFRRSFNVGDPAPIVALGLELLRDDAAAVYINGSEVFRDTTLPGGAAFNTLATAAVDEADGAIAIAVSPTVLVAGENVIAVEVHQNSVSSSDMSFSLRVVAQAPAPAVVAGRGGTWSYLDDGSDQGLAWRDSGFDDSAWETGAAPLGYGAGEATTVGFGGDENNKFATTYFRHRFEVVGASAAVTARLRVRRDDGVAVYLNGVEISRQNLAPGATASDFATATTGDSESFREVIVDPTLLVAGENVIAAEVHQASGTSSDIVFDAEIAFSSAQVLRVAHIDVAPSADPDSDMDGIPDSYELANGLTVGVDDSALDLDADGQSNLAEFIAGTVANDPTSVLRVTGVAPAAADAQLVLTVATVAGKSYRAQTSAVGETWADVGGSDWVASGVSSTVMVPAEAPALWRVIVVQAP